MAFKQKILEINQEFKDWLTATFALKSHPHDYMTKAQVEALIASAGGSEPDYSRAYTFWQQASLWEFKYRVFKVNVPGYIMYNQRRGMLDSDHVIFVASHPGYHNFINNSTINQYTSHRQEVGGVTIPAYVNYKAVFGGNSLPGGDTWQTCIYPITPGTSTYIHPATEYGSASGYNYYNWVFIPCKNVPASIAKSNYVTCVGMSANPGSYYRDRERVAISSANVTPAFSGNWKDNFNSSYGLNTSNIKYIDTVFIRSSNWGWNNYNSGNDGSLGRRFFMFDACATGANRRWLAYNDYRHQLYYDTTRKCWALTYGWDTYYEAPDANGTGDPWSLTWKTGPANSGYTTMPVLTMQRYN